METKSLRQLAIELGVSVSYLSQVSNGKRLPSMKVYQALRQYDYSVKQSVKQNAAKKLLHLPKMSLFAQKYVQMI